MKIKQIIRYTYIICDNKKQTKKKQSKMSTTVLGVSSSSLWGQLTPNKPQEPAVDDWNPTHERYKPPKKVLFYHPRQVQEGF